MADSEQLAASAAGAAPAASVGSTLRQARLARDLLLEQVSSELRIETRQLDALENDQFERIGVPVFVKGYIKQYGAYLGLDYRDLLAQYYRQDAVEEVQIQPSKTITLRDERQITVWIVAVIVLVALAIALGLWWVNGGALPGAPAAPATQTSLEPAPEPVAAASPSTLSRESAAAAPVVPPAVNDAIAVTPPSAASIATSTAASGPAEAPGSTAGSTPAPATAASTAESAPASATAQTAATQLAIAAELAASSSRPATPAATPATPSAAAPGQTGLSQLDLLFEQESWAEISDARGQRLFYGMAGAGRAAKLNGEPPFAVVLGNSSGVKIALDGADFPVPTSGRTGYARFSVDTAEE